MSLCTSDIYTLSDEENFFNYRCFSPQQLDYYSNKRHLIPHLKGLFKNIFFKCFSLTQFTKSTF